MAKIITLEPEWESITLWMAHVIAGHGYDRNNLESVAIFIRQIQYLTLKDSMAVDRIIKNLEQAQVSEFGDV